MVTFYLDTSALVKLYVKEAGSEWLRSRVPLVSSMSISLLGVAEVVSALNRRRREGALPPDDYQLIRDAFYGDCSTAYEVVPLTPAIVQQACALLEKHPLRAGDAIHLSTALAIQVALHAHSLPDLIFLSADDGLNAAAAAEGLAVDNPNHHM